MRRVKNQFLKGFIGLSLLLHLHLFLLIAGIISLNPDGCDLDSTFVPLEMVLVPTKESESDKKKEQERLKEEEKKEEKKDKDPKGQVVDLPPPLEEKQPDKAKFLSEYDTKVERETKGPPVPFKPGKLLANRPLRQVQSTPPNTASEQKRIARKIMKLAMRTKPELPKSDLEKSDSGEDPPKMPPTPPMKAPRGPPIRSQNASPKKQVTMRDLRLSDKELAKAVGTRANDYLKGIKEGKQTLLNSKRWRFASFFNRVKRQVAQNWHPDVVYRRRDPTGNVYGFRDRLTILRVKLTPKGKLKDVHLEKACGVEFLDDEAMSAFRAAEPFPNPPSGLVDKDTGMISFRFGFLFEISRRPNFKIFRFK